MRKKRRNDNGSGGDWMQTYGDLVTLLLCFFVLLFSFSTVDAAKWEALVRSFSGASGVMTDDSPGRNSPLQRSPSYRYEELEWAAPQHPQPDPERLAQATLPPQPTPTQAPAATPTPTPDPTPTPAPTTTTTAAATTTAQATTTTTAAPTPTPVPELEDFHSQLQSYFKDQDIEDAVQLEFHDPRVTIRLIASVIFEPGSARLLPEAESILRGAASIIDEHTDSIATMRTEGHTDDRFEDEAEENDAFQLAADRAVVVNDFFRRNSAISSGIMSVSGHGSNNPVASNDSAAGRDQNNRVDVVLSSD